MRHRAHVAFAIAFATVTLAFTATPALAGQLPVVYNGISGLADIISKFPTAAIYAIAAAFGAWALSASPILLLAAALLSLPA